jgi:RimJ/RimL family protein N-acetyltransferase
VTIEGTHAVLRPIAVADVDVLFPATHGHEAEALWAYMPVGPFADRAAMSTYVDGLTRALDPITFAILEARSGAVVGYGSFMRIDPANRVIEVGNLMFSPAMQRTPVATDAIHLMARHAFDRLGYRRFEWKCNAFNEPSRRAALRFGFTFEGIFRQHMIVKGRNRDTAWYAMLDGEWPARAQAFASWLDAANFGPDGRQKRRLSDFQEAR